MRRGRATGQSAAEEVGWGASGAGGALRPRERRRSTAFDTIRQENRTSITVRKASASVIAKATAAGQRSARRWNFANARSRAISMES